MPNDKDDLILDDWNRLASYGIVLYGKNWQTDMSDALELKNPSHLRGWKRRGVPAYVWSKVKDIAKNKIAEITEIIL